MSRQSDPPFGGELWQGWKRFCQVVAAGAVAVFLFEIGTLVASLNDFEAGMEKGALWAMLLMIFVTLGVVAVIGGGLARAIQRDRRRQAGDDGEKPGG